LNKILSYTQGVPAPAEAHQIERMLHIIFSSNYEVNEYMNNEVEFDKKLLEVKPKSQIVNGRTLLQKIKSLCKRGYKN
jgi:hypothetical protein